MSVPVIATELLPAIVWMIVKVSVLVAIAAIAHGLVRRRTSAATRHLVWTLAIAAILMLPVLSSIAPRWGIAVAPAAWNALSGTPLASAADSPVARTSVPPSSLNGIPTDVVARPDRTVITSDAASAAGSTAVASSTRTTVAASTSTSAPTSASTTTFASVPASASDAASDARPVSVIRMDRASTWLAIYFAIAFGLLVRLAAQRFTVQRLARQATEVTDPEWCELFADCADRIGVHRSVRLLRSRAQSMPMAFGTRRPSILMPAIADTWSEDRRRAVLLHELAHVARRDCLTQMLAAVACAVYWAHPGVWWIARRLRIERELACDDRVLSLGTQARDYAGHLLELAYTLGGHRAPALVVSMARPRQLEGRMLAVLDAARNRATPGVRSRFAAVAITSALVLPLASVEATRASNAVDRDPTLVAADMSAANDHTSGVAHAPIAWDRRSPSPSPSPTPSPSPSPSPSVTPSPSASPSPSPESVVDEDDDEDDYKLPGTWDMRPGPEGTPGIVHLRLMQLRNSWGFSVALDKFEGLTSAQLNGTGTPVRFALRRDAGTFAFEGTFRGGVGAGTYAFTLNPTFQAEFAKRGFSGLTPKDQYALAKADIGFNYLDELTKQGYPKPDAALLVRAGHHGVHFDYLREMGTLNYKVGALETLIKLRDHGISPRYIREMTALGYGNLSTEELLRARDHGVSPEYARDMKAGFPSITLPQLVNARDHGVSPEFIREIGEQGFKGLTMEELIKARDHGVSANYMREVREIGHKLTLPQLIDARDHGVSADYMREMAALGYKNLSIDTLKRARNHGVSTDYIRDLAALGYKDLSLDTLINMRDHGVSANFVRELKELGYDRINLEEAVALRDHGVSADRIRRANAKAGTRLPLDMIKALVSGGSIQ